MVLQVHKDTPVGIAINKQNQLNFSTPEIEQAKGSKSSFFQYFDAFFSKPPKPVTTAQLPILNAVPPTIPTPEPQISSLEDELSNRLSETVKSLLQETKLRTAIVGCKGSGKSYLLNTLLEATAPSEKEYSELVLQAAEQPYNPGTSYTFNSPENSPSNRRGSSPIDIPSSKSNLRGASSPSPRLFSPKFSSPKGGSYSQSTGYQFDSEGRTTYTFTEDKSYTSATAYSFSEDTPAYKKPGQWTPPAQDTWDYTQATAYSFAPSSMEQDQDLQWEIGEITETFVPDQHYATTIDWQKERPSGRFEVDDEHPYLLPQGPKRPSHGPRCYDFRYGKIPELIVSFVEESKLRAELWELHEVEAGIVKCEAAHRQRLEQRYRAVLGLRESQKVPLADIHSFLQFQFRPDVSRLLGKTYRFRGLGRNFTLDRIYVRQKLREIMNGYGHYVTNVLLKMPCKILEGNRELAELSDCTEGLSSKTTRIIQNSNILVVVLTKDGLSTELVTLLKNTGFVQRMLMNPEQRRIVFVDLSEVREAKLPVQIFSEQTTQEFKAYEYSVNLQYQKLLFEERKNVSKVDKISSDAYVLSVRPRLYSLLQSNSLPQLWLATYSPSEVMSGTYIPALLGYITNMALSQCAEPFKEMNKNWVEQQFGNNVTSSLVSSISGLSLGAQTTFETPRTPQLFELDRTEALSSTMAQLTATFQERFRKWKGELMDTVQNLHTLLLPKAHECYSAARADWAKFKDTYLQTNEACRAVFNPSHGGRALGADMNLLTCGALLHSAPALWNDYIARSIPGKVEEMLQFSRSILEECVSMIEKSELETEAERARITKLLAFCRGTHEKAVEKFAEFKRQTQADTSRIVKDACVDALQAKVLAKSVNIQGVKNYHDLISKALPDIPIEAAKNIQQRFFDKMQEDLKLLDVAEKDLQRAIRCVMVVLKSKSNSAKTEIPTFLPAPKSKEGKMESILDLADSYRSFHEEDMEVTQQHTVQRLGVSHFDEITTPQMFNKNVWNDAFNRDLQRIRFQDMLNQAKLEVVHVKVDGNCQFRALAHQIYGTEEAHSIVRLLVMSEILGNPASYEKFISIKGMELQEYVSVMAKEGAWGDHLTLCAFANFYGADLLVYSPLFSNPLLIQTRNPQTSRMLCISYINENHYQSLISTAKNTKQEEDPDHSESAMDEEETPAPIHRRWYYLSDVRSESEELRLKATKSSTPLVKLYSPKSLSELCIMKIAQYANSMPCLDGALPEELVQNILSLLIQERRVDDSILERLLDDSIRFLECDNSLQITDSSLRLIARTCPNLTRISLSNCILLSNESVVHLACICPNLEMINLSGCFGIGNLGVQELARRCPRLVSVNLSGCVKITDSAIMELTLACTHLHTLNLRDCAKITDASFEHIGHEISVVDLSGCDLVTDKAIIYFALRCSKLTSLKISSRQVTDLSIMQLSQSCKNLRTLELNGCELVSDDSVRSLAVNCKLLETLTMACCRNATFGAPDQRFPNLVSLDLTRCLNVVDSSLKRIASECKMLECINLSSCEDITDVSIVEIARHCKKLREVNLSKCMNVTDVSVIELASNCPNIQKLVLYNCHKITDAGIAQVANSCRQLRALDLSSCQNLTDSVIQSVAIGCPFLEVLCLEECKFTEEGINAIAANCVCLNTIKVAYCKGITDESLLRLAQGSPNMAHVDLSYCNNVTIAGLKEALKYWPYLKTLNLRGFHQIVAEAFGHSNIQVLNLSWCKNVQDSAIEQIAASCPSLVNLDLAWAGKITANVIHKLVQSIPTLRFINLRGCTKVSTLATKYLSAANIVIYN